MKQNDLNKIIEFHVDNAISEAFSPEILGAAYIKNDNSVNPSSRRSEMFLNGAMKAFYEKYGCHNKYKVNGNEYSFEISPVVFYKQDPDTLNSVRIKISFTYPKNNDTREKYVCTSKLGDATNNDWIFFENGEKISMDKTNAITNFLRDVPTQFKNKMRDAVMAFEDYKKKYIDHIKQHNEPEIEDWMK